MSLRVGVLRFPGTNCDRDVYQALNKIGLRPRWLWHQDLFESKEFDALILPGGFSFGDYLRSGALAARSPVMKSVREAATRGVSVLGICNGFQILCEAGLLPGVLTRNKELRFIDDWVELTLRNSQAFFAAKTAVGTKVRLPIAHADGRFHVTEDELKKLQDKRQVWWTYENNPNGSVGDIAGVKNEVGNVAGLMPHPERAMADWMGSRDGFAFFAGGLK